MGKIDDNFIKINENQMITTTRNGDTFALTTKCRNQQLCKKMDIYILEVIGSTQTHAFRGDGTYSNCLHSAGRNNVPMLKLGENEEEYRVRRLTPRECERLQGFPDDWTRYGKDGEEISDTQRYKCCGNAVTTNVITFIVDEMFGDDDVV